MKCSTRGRYALRLMIDLAVNAGESPVTLKDISRRQGVSVKYLEQIVPLLARAGLLSSSRGAQGGYRLAKPADQYTAGEILRVTEGRIAPVDCSTAAGDPCPRRGACPAQGFWQGLERVIDEYVDGVTLTDLAAQEAAAK